MTAASFARGIGCLERCVARWLNGTNVPSLEYVIMTADYMDCSIDYLLGRSDDPHCIKSAAPVTFAERLSLLIETSATNRNKLAKVCGVGSSTVSKWILRGQLPKPDVACALANYFNCSVDYLIGRADNK